MPPASRVRAPELTGRGGWIGTGTAAPRLSDLRGKFVLLDFWTFCCINCLHVLDELRPLEQAYADVLVTVGVHSPKFAHEAEHAAVVAAVERYDVRHPVLDDPELVTWRQYAVRAWPTLVLVDPEGYVVAQLSGEGHGHSLARMLEALVAEHAAKGTLHRGTGPYVAPAPKPGLLAFPSKVLELPGADLLVADAAHHRLVVVAADGTTVRRTVGTGRPGRADGPASRAELREPGGMVRLPESVAAQVGYDVVVADTVNHLLRGLDTTTWSVRTVAGTGSPWMQGGSTGGPALDVALSSPWDLAWFDEAVVVAAAGVHRLDRFDPVASTLAPYAGTTNEGLVDGALERAWFAQPSGLATSSDAATLWVVDAETSALRRVSGGTVHTVVGTGLFDFGHVDGPAGSSRLQHPLGCCELPDGSVAIADAYNGAVRRYDPSADEVSTIATGLAEPSDVVVVADQQYGQLLLVVESGANRLTRVPVPDAVRRVRGPSWRTQRPVTDLAPGGLRICVTFVPPPGQHLDDRYGPSTRLVVSASPPGLLVSGAGTSTGLERDLTLATPADGSSGEGVLHVSARAASCDDPDGPGGSVHPACHVHQQDWGVPVKVTPTGATRLTLVLSGPMGDAPPVA